MSNFFNKDKTKKDKDKKLIHRLYVLIIIIVTTCLIAGGFIFVVSSDVTRQSELMEETASLQQDFAELVNHLNQTSIIYYQLSTSGYNQNLTEDADDALTEASSLFEEMQDRVEQGDPLEHYFQHLNDSIVAYQLIYEENFTSIYVGDEADRISSRVVPVITRTEETINSINERIQENLADRRDEASDSLQQSLTRSGVIIVTALISLIAVTFASLILFGKNLTSGVNLVMKRIRAYHDGQLTYDHEANRNDEFSTIDSRLKNMADQLLSIINRNKQVSEDVLSVVQSTSQKSSDQLESMSEVDKTIGEFSKEMERQTDFTGTISATAEELSSSSGEIQSSISKVNTQLKELESASNHGLNLMNQLEQTVDNLNLKTSTTAERVNQMSDQLEHITSFIQGIDNIAKQTNLLAINASIEAAKAGESGKSFAVVANEIRKLSQGTNDFSDQIKQVLEELSSEVGHVVTAFSDFKSESLESLESTVESAKLFKQISTGNTNVNREHQEIDESITEINQAIENVAESVAELVEGATVLQERSESVAKIIEDQTDRQKELADEVISLEQTANLLNS